MLNHSLNDKKTAEHVERSDSASSCHFNKPWQSKNKQSPYSSTSLDLVHTMLVDLSAFIIYIITSDLYFHINIQCLKLRSPSNDEMHNQIPIQRCIVMLNEKIRHSTRTKTLDAYVQSGEEILRSQHVFDWTHVVESLSSVWFNDGFGENHTFLKCQSFRSAWQE